MGILYLLLVNLCGMGIGMISLTGLPVVPERVYLAMLIVIVLNTGYVLYKASKG